MGSLLDSPELEAEVKDRDDGSHATLTILGRFLEKVVSLGPHCQILFLYILSLSCRSSEVHISHKYSQHTKTWFCCPRATVVVILDHTCVFEIACWVRAESGLFLSNQHVFLWFVHLLQVFLKMNGILLSHCILVIIIYFFLILVTHKRITKIKKASYKSFLIMWFTT